MLAPTHDTPHTQTSNAVSRHFTLFDSSTARLYDS
jgi:hypothetical protein